MAQQLTDLAIGRTSPNAKDTLTAFLILVAQRVGVVRAACDAGDDCFYHGIPGSTCELTILRDIQVTYY